MVLIFFLIFLNFDLLEGVETVRYFNCKKLRYVWDAESMSFTKLKGLDVNVPSLTIHKQKAISSFTRNIRFDLPRSFA